MPKTTVLRKDHLNIVMSNHVKWSISKDPGFKAVVLYQLHRLLHLKSCILVPLGEMIPMHCLHDVAHSSKLSLSLITFFSALAGMQMNHGSNSYLYQWTNNRRISLLLLKWVYGNLLLFLLPLPYKAKWLHLLQQV